MLKPAAMQRTVILASKSRQAAIIETLHDLQAAHFVEFHETPTGDLEGFRMGQPLPGAGAASERLVRVRALLRHLGLEGAHAQRKVAVRDLEGRLDVNLDQVERDVGAAVEQRESMRQQLAEGRELEAKLEPLRALPLRLEDYRGYESLTVFVGRADAAFADDVRRAAPDALLVQGEGTLFALFVPNAQAPEASEALYRHGYAEVEVPEGKGAPDERIREIQSERGALETRLEKSERDLERLAGDHRDFLLAAAEHLGIAVEKAEAPLNFPSTENAFVVDAWVPADRVDEVERAIKTATGDNVAVMRLETVTHHEGHGGHGKGTDEAHGGIDAGMGGVPTEHVHGNGMYPPTKYDNPGGVKRFEWFTNLFSTPRYDEVDPTLVFTIFFPLFFGFMIGDLGLGILMVLLGFLLIRKLPRVDGMKQLGTAFVVAGIVAAAFGGIVFKDALGIPLGVTHHMEEYTTEAGIANPTCMDFYQLAHEPTWGCILGMGTVHSEPIVAKVTDIETMLLLSVLAAFIHLLIGLGFGIRNELGHGAKHVAAKFGYLLLLLTFFPAVVALLRPDMFAGFAGGMDAHPALSFHIPFTTAQAYMTAGAGFVLGAVILGWAEGFGGVLEIPTMFSAIMSYLRLGAVAIAKGAMAIAFNQMTLVAALTGGGLVLILGIIGFLVAQAVLFVLGLLSGGIQALRLNFVEFFTKFYKGGGTPFKPFGRSREVTLVNPSGPSGQGPAGAVAVTAVLINPQDTS